MVRRGIDWKFWDQSELWKENCTIGIKNNDLW